MHLLDSLWGLAVAQKMSKSKDVKSYIFGNRMRLWFSWVCLCVCMHVCTMLRILWQPSLFPLFKTWVTCCVITASSTERHDMIMLCSSKVSSLPLWKSWKILLICQRFDRCFFLDWDGYENNQSGSVITSTRHARPTRNTTSGLQATFHGYFVSYLYTVYCVPNINIYIYNLGISIEFVQLRAILETKQSYPIISHWLVGSLHASMRKYTSAFI